MKFSDLLLEKKLAISLSFEFLKDIKNVAVFNVETKKNIISLQMISDVIFYFKTVLRNMTNTT